MIPSRRTFVILDQNSWYKGQKVKEELATIMNGKDGSVELSSSEAQN